MLSKQSLEILIDLIEIKLSTIIVQDKDDIKEVRKLKACRDELIACHRERLKEKRVHGIEPISSQVL